MKIEDMLRCVLEYVLKSLAIGFFILILEHVLQFIINYTIMKTVWRKKKCRTIEIDYVNVCWCFGPLSLDKEKLDQCLKVTLEPDEFQTLVYQDQQNLTMAQGSKKMWISKTVYAWIYRNAREKVTCALLHNHILILACPVDNSS